MKKVIVAGHICLDITPVFPEQKVRRISEILSPGKLLQMGKADVHTGGAVANTGLAMKILGADVTLMGKIGRDAFGDMVCSILKQYGADSGMIVSGTESTSYSVILAVPGIDRIFLHNPGANHTFQASDIPEAALKETALFHFGYPPLMRSMYVNDGEELVKIMKRAKEAGAADWKKILERVIPYVDFFAPSIEELCYMLDSGRFSEWQKRADGSDITEMLDIVKDVKPLAQQCMELGAKVILIKCGAPGMYYKTADRGTLVKIGSKVGLDIDGWSNQEGFEKSYIPECILSGTGAGDTSIAAFLTAMLEGYPLEPALHLSAATGASCVAAYDALSGLKSFHELEDKINAGWQKNK